MIEKWHLAPTGYLISFKSLVKRKSETYIPESLLFHHPLSQFFPSLRIITEAFEDTYMYRLRL
jgi:hypothetical protein